MREFHITGNLGANPEILTDKNGGSYVRLRVANHEFGDPENETRWFDVAMFSVPPIISHLKKGSGVRVIGDYKDSIYTSDKYGVQINRNITAFKIDFWNGGMKKEEGQDANATAAPAPQPQAAAQPAEPATAEKPKSPKAKTAKAAPAPAEPAQPALGADDDLPF